MASQDNKHIPCIQRENYFIGKISHMSRMEELQTIRSKLEMFGLKKDFEDSCFGFLLKMHIIEFIGPLVHHLLMMQDKKQSGKELTIVVNGHPRRFGYEEFSLITGMMFTGEDSIQYLDSRLKHQYFRRDNIITKGRLCEVYERLPKNTDRHDVLRLSLLIALEIVLLGDQKSQKINLQYFYLVEDLDRFNKFPWGKVVYEFTIRKMKSCMVNRVAMDVHMLEKNEVQEEVEDDLDIEGKGEDRYSGSKSYSTTSYNVYGFPLALQVWAYEAIPALADDLGFKRESDIMPRILKWENKKTGRLLRFKYLERTYFSHDDLFVLQVLVPTKQEMDTSYYQSSLAARREMTKEFGEELYVNVEKVEKRGKEKLIDESQPSSSTTSLDRVMEELLVVKQEVKEMKQMFATFLDIFKNGNVNSPHEHEGVFQTSNPIRFTNSIGGVDAEVGVNIRSENVRNEHDDIIFGRKNRVEKNLSDDVLNKLEEKDPNTEIVLGEEHYVAMEDSLPEKEETTLNIHVHMDMNKNLSEVEDKNIVIISLEKELQKRNLAVLGYEIENCLQRGSDDVRASDTDDCMIVTGPTKTNKYYTRKNRSIGPLLRSPYDVYMTNGRKRKVSKMDQTYDNVLAGSSNSFYNINANVDCDKYLRFLSWLDKESCSMVETINVGCPSKGTANAIWFHRLFKIEQNLFNSHIDCGLWLLRKKFHKCPTKFPLKGWSTVDSYFFARLMTHQDEWKRAEGKNELYDWFSDIRLTNYVLGSVPDYGRPWFELDVLYGIISFKDHWVGLEFDLQSQEIHVYDSLPSHIRDAQLKRHMQSICKMFPDFCKQCGVYETKRHGSSFTFSKTWKFFRNQREIVPRQENSGDCGIYAIKFIECRTIRNPLIQVKHEHILSFRKKICYELYYSVDNVLLM